MLYDFYPSYYLNSTSFVAMIIKLTLLLLILDIITLILSSTSWLLGCCMSDQLSTCATTLIFHNFMINHRITMKNEGREGDRGKYHMGQMIYHQNYSSQIVLFSFSIFILSSQFIKRQIFLSISKEIIMIKRIVMYIVVWM